TIAGSPRGWIAVADHEGTVRFWSDGGRPLGEVETGVGSVASLEVLPDDTLLVVGQRGTVQLGRKHEVLRRVATHGAWTARFGPGDDELTAVGDGKLAVYGFDGTVRRELALDAVVGNEPVLDPTAHHAVIGVGEDLYLLDLVTMKRALLARDAWGPPAYSHHSSRYAFVDHEHRVHLIELDGTPIKTLETATRPDALVLSAT